MLRFYLGTHEPHWLRLSSVPLFISRHRLASLRTLPPASINRALDSGGFTELNNSGHWSITAAQYATEVRRYQSEIGLLDWAAPMDYMCEPAILAKTGRSILEHQWLTTFSVLQLRSIAPEIHWIPVLQGWTVDDYRRHLDIYATAGIDLENEPTVGIGTMCRRQGTIEAAEILAFLPNLNYHAFGMKTSGLKMNHPTLTSADSLAWSFGARRRQIRLPGCTHSHCGNCFRYAMLWREGLIAPLLADSAHLQSLAQAELGAGGRWKGLDGAKQHIQHRGNLGVQARQWIAVIGAEERILEHVA